MISPDCEAFQGLRTPALVLDGDAIERNIAEMAAAREPAGVALRPHAKTHKSADIAGLQIKAGAIGICCATIAEAEALAAAGIPGLLITSPMMGEAKFSARRGARPHRRRDRRGRSPGAGRWPARGVASG